MAGPNWIINDSEDEDSGLLDSVPQPPPHITTTTSPISNFTNPLANKVSMTENTSPVSQFPTNVLPRQSSTISSADVLTVSDAPPPAKRQKSKPIPAYKSAKAARNAALAASTSSFGDSITTSSVGPASRAATELYSSLPISDVLPGASNAGASSVASSSKQSLAFDGIVISRSKSPEMMRKKTLKTIVIDLLSDDDSPNREPVSVKSQRKAAMFRIPEPPRVPSSSILPPSEPPSTVPSSRPPSPIFGGTHANSTPPSSPVIPRPKKRKSTILDDDFEFEVREASVSRMSAADPTAASPTSGTSALKKKAANGTTKEKKSRSKKAHVDGGPEKPNKSKVKSKAEDKIEYKSKEFIEDSEGEDDLLLRPIHRSASCRPKVDDVVMLPSTAITLPTSSRSEPSDADRSVPASTSKSILPSVPMSAAPSADFSDPSSSRAQADPSNLTKSVNARSVTPFTVPETSMPNKDPAKKKKKNQEIEIGANKKRDLEKDSSRPPDSGKKVSPASRSKSPSPKPSDHASFSSKANPKKRAIVDSDDDDDDASKPSSKKANSPARKKPESRDEDKENQSICISPPFSITSTPIPTTPAPTRPNPAAPASAPRPRTSSTPKGGLPPRRDSMSALIRRASSKVNTPLGTPTPTHTHSPLAKSSRAALSRIAPLHPNRRPPPPAPPKPPAPKKSKKMLEMEERWEEELGESVQGWACLSEEERSVLRRAKRDAELGYED